MRDWEPISLFRSGFRTLVDAARDESVSVPGRINIGVATVVLAAWVVTLVAFLSDLALGGSVNLGKFVNLSLGGYTVVLGILVGILFLIAIGLWGLCLWVFIESRGQHERD